MDRTNLTGEVTPRLKEGGYLTSNGNPREPSEA
jgi:hypothetical protein